MGTGYFVQNNTTIILPDDIRRTNAERRRPIFCAKLEAWRMFHIFHFLQSDVDFGIVNLSWVFNAIPSEKKWPDINTFYVNL